MISSFVAAAIVDAGLRRPRPAPLLEILVAIYAYAVQIYADFSGYTDIAIGCALLLGLRFPQNFDAPYAATSMQAFWRKWHMTLSFWLRDYLYIPLGGNKGGENRRDLNLFLTMLIGGFWHGAAWTFIVWGAIHGVALAAERRDPRRPARRPAGPGPVVAGDPVDHHLPHRLPRLGVLPGRVLRPRLRAAVAAGRRARHRVGRDAHAAVRDRRLDRLAVRPDRVDGPGPGRLLPLRPRPSRPSPWPSASCSSTPSGPRASPPSSTSSSEHAP